MTAHIVARLHLGDCDSLHEHTAAMVRGFLEAHGLGMNRMPVDAVLTVTRDVDGAYRLSAWAFKVGLPVCGNCEACVEMEAFDVPLAAPVPFVPGFEYKGDLDLHLPVVLPDDVPALAAAAEAHQSRTQSTVINVAYRDRDAQQRRLQEFRARAVAREVPA